MDNFFENFLPTTGKNAKENKITKLEMEIDRLQLSLRIANQTIEKRKETMEIMFKKLNEQDALIRRLDEVLRQQDSTLAKMRNAMVNQQKKLNHIKRIDERMDNLQSEQCEIIEFAKRYPMTENA